MEVGVGAEIPTSGTESQQSSGGAGVDDRLINCLIMMHRSVVSTTLCGGRPSSPDGGSEFLQCEKIQRIFFFFFNIVTNYT